MEDLNHDAVAAIFGTNVRRLRESKGWSQSELARKMKESSWPKYSQMAVSRTEDGARTVRLDEALALADLLGSNIDDLLQSRDEFDESFSRVNELSKEATLIIESMNDLGWKFGRVKGELISACDSYLSLIGSKEKLNGADEYRIEVAQRFSQMVQRGAYDAIAYAAERQMLAAFPLDGDYETLRGGIFDQLNALGDEVKNGDD